MTVDLFKAGARRRDGAPGDTLDGVADAVARLPGPHLPFLKRKQPSVAALLFHRFFAEDESRQCGVDRLRRELDWLRSKYNPISLSQFVAGLRNGVLPDRAALVTSDDALVDILGVADEFKSFGVPLSVFVCAGWTAAASAGIGEDLVARAASDIQWYDGDDVEISYGSQKIVLSSRDKARNIDTLIAEQDAMRPHLDALCTRIEGLIGRKPGCCTWEQLRHLASAGVGIGAHSVTHVPLTRVSALRRRFEIAESKRLCEALIGTCEAFAYPYGVQTTYSAETRAELESAGFSAAFLSHAGFITDRTDPMTLPRFSMPDGPMPFFEFRARACGAGIVARHLKELLSSKSVFRRKRWISPSPR